MRVTRLVSAEIVGRPLNFLLSLMVIAAAAILFVTGPTLIGGYAEDTKKQLGVLQAETDTVLEEMQSETDALLAMNWQLACKAIHSKMQTATRTAS